MSLVISVVASLIFTDFFLVYHIVQYDLMAWKWFFLYHYISLLRPVQVFNFA